MNKYNYTTNKKENPMSNVKRVYSEKKPEFAVKAKELSEEISSYLNIDTVTNVRVSAVFGRGYNESSEPRTSKVFSEVRYLNYALVAFLLFCSYNWA